jgi:hypothetical protein
VGWAACSCRWDRFWFSWGRVTLFWLWCCWTSFWRGSLCLFVSGDSAADTPPGPACSTESRAARSSVGSFCGWSRWGSMFWWWWLLGGWVCGFGVGVIILTVLMSVWSFMAVVR